MTQKVSCKLNYSFTGPMWVIRLYVPTIHYLLNCKFAEQKVNVSQVKLLHGKHLPCSKFARNDRYFPWGALAVAIAIITQQQKQDTRMKVDRYRVLLPHPYIHRVLYAMYCTRYRRWLKKFDFIFIGFVNVHNLHTRVRARSFILY